MRWRHKGLSRGSLLAFAKDHPREKRTPQKHKNSPHLRSCLCQKTARGSADSTHMLLLEVMDEVGTLAGRRFKTTKR